MAPTKHSQAKAEAVASLLSLLSPGDTIYSTVNHVSRSGMFRVLSFYIPLADDNTGKLYIRRLDTLIAKATGFSYNDRHEGIAASGCGMDMGFHVVYNLGRVLWPNGTESPHGYRNGEPDNDGGYALKSTWL
jgi:hypothetical protein